jgi:hypothetical protein
VECFGGQEPVYAGGRGSLNPNWIRERIRNAFMLVYDRKDVEEELAKGGAHKPAVPAEIMYVDVSSIMNIMHVCHISDVDHVCGG